jgi:hypothetical protein
LRDSRKDPHPYRRCASTIWYYNCCDLLIIERGDFCREDRHTVVSLLWTLAFAAMDGVWRKNVKITPCIHNYALR